MYLYICTYLFQILIKDTPQLAHDDEVSGVCCEFNLWFISRLSACIAS